MATIGRSALVNANLLIARGADFEAAFRYSTGTPPVPVDLTGWTGRAQIRDYPGGPVWLTVTDTTGIALGSDGTITVHLPHTATEGTVWDSRFAGVWDLELTSPTGWRRRFAEGSVQVSQDVTRD